MNLFSKRTESFVEVQKKQDEKITIKLMHGPGRAVKDICLSARRLKVVSAVLGLAMTVGIAGGSYLVWDYQRLLDLREENAQLQATNETQAVVIEELKTFTESIQEKMVIIDDLDSQVREKVGLEESTEVEEAEEDNPRIVAGMTVSRSALTNLENQYSEAAEELDSLEDLVQELADADRELTMKAHSLEKLQTEVDRQLAYEAAMPSFWPMQGRLTSPFGTRSNPTGRGTEMHTGIDIANRSGTSIYAAGDGVVTFAGYKSGWGRMILISHGYGYVTQYAHNSTILVKEGQRVTKGEMIAKCGSTGRTTGPHLHFGLQLNGKWVDPMSMLKR